MSTILVLLTSEFDIIQGRNSRGYREASPPPVFDWRGKNTSQASSVGWGRRIYDQGEIEVEDERNKLFFVKVETSYLSLRGARSPTLGSASSRNLRPAI